MANLPRILSLIIKGTVRVTVRINHTPDALSIAHVPHTVSGITAGRDVALASHHIKARDTRADN